MATPEGEVPVTRLDEDFIPPPPPIHRETRRLENKTRTNQMSPTKVSAFDPSQIGSSIADLGQNLFSHIDRVSTRLVGDAGATSLTKFFSDDTSSSSGSSSGGGNKASRGAVAASTSSPRTPPSTTRQSPYTPVPLARAATIHSTSTEASVEDDKTVQANNLSSIKDKEEALLQGRILRIAKLRGNDKKKLRPSLSPSPRYSTPTQGNNVIKHHQNVSQTTAPTRERRPLTKAMATTATSSNVGGSKELPRIPELVRNSLPLADAAETEDDSSTMPHFPIIQHMDSEENFAPKPLVPVSLSAKMKTGRMSPDDIDLICGTTGWTNEISAVAATDENTNDSDSNIEQCGSAYDNIAPFSRMRHTITPVDSVRQGQGDNVRTPTVPSPVKPDFVDNSFTDNSLLPYYPDETKETMTKTSSGDHISSTSDKRKRKRKCTMTAIYTLIALGLVVIILSSVLGTNKFNLRGGSSSSSSSSSTSSSVLTSNIEGDDNAGNDNGNAGPDDTEFEKIYVEKTKPEVVTPDVDEGTSNIGSPTTSPTNAPTKNIEGGVPKPSALSSRSPTQNPTKRPTGSDGQIEDDAKLDLVDDSSIAPWSPTMSPTRMDPSNPTETSMEKSEDKSDNFSFYVYGKGPYKSDDESTLSLELNSNTDGIFSVHLGDVFTATEKDCNESTYEDAASLLRQSQMPMFVVPGDEDWMDCKKPEKAFQLWSQTFVGFEQNWQGMNSVPLITERLSGREENFAIFYKNVLFLGINNGGDKDKAREMDEDEYKFREEEILDWVKEHVQAHEEDENLSAIFIFAHAYRFVDVFEWVASRNFKGKSVPFVLMHAGGGKFDLSKPLSDNFSSVKLDNVKRAPPLRITISHSALGIADDDENIVIGDTVMINRQGGEY